MYQQYKTKLTIKSHHPDGFFCGYASVFHLKDHHGEVITPNAFKNSLAQWKAHGGMPKLLWQHDQKQPIGIWHEIYEDDYGLFVKGQLLLDLQRAREAYALLKAGVIDGMSIGFRPVKTQKYGNTQDHYIEEIDLQEISLVTFAANSRAKVTAVKASDKIQNAHLANQVTQSKETEMTDTMNARLDELDMLMKKSTQRIEKMEISLQRPAFPEAKFTAETTDFSQFVRKGIETFNQKSLTSQTEPGGGYLIPSPVVKLINQGITSHSVIRQLAANTNINADSLDLLLEKTEGDAGWVSEIAEREETGTPELAKIHIPVHQIYAKPRVSQKLLDDASINIDQWVCDKIADKFAKIENNAFLFGSGTGQPRGILTADICEIDKEVWGKVSTLITGSETEFATVDDILQVVYALKSKYLPGASWIMPRSVAFKIAKMKDKQGQYIWQRSLSAEQPNTLLGYPVYLCDDMIKEKTPLRIVFGNVKEAYHVADRAQMSMLRDPFSAKPYVEFYATKRVGGDLVKCDALKYIQFDKA